MNDLTVKELRVKAKTAGITGYSKMRKSELIDSLNNNSSKWKIYTKEGCSYCKKAKDLLKSNNISFKTIVITDKNKAKIYKQLDSKTKSYRYFPMIFKGDKFVGGYTDLEKDFGKKSKGCLIS